MFQKDSLQIKGQRIRENKGQGEKVPHKNKKKI